MKQVEGIASHFVAERLIIDWDAKMFLIKPVVPLLRDYPLHLQNSKNEASLLALPQCCKSIRHAFMFFKWKPRFHQDASEPAVLKNIVFDWETFFRLCEVWRFQSLVFLT